MVKTWDQIIASARAAINERQLAQVYSDRLEFEIKEIDKQGANAYWVDLISNNKRFSANPNKLVLPWLFEMVSDDPIATRTEPMLCTVRASVIKEHLKQHGSIPSDLIKDQDMPDIDLDCLPEARDPIKAYAMEKYGAGLDGDGYGPVCSVGTWQTYKFKSAIMAVSKALQAVNQAEVYELTTKLPDDVDGLKDGGVAVCKNQIIDANTDQSKECGTAHSSATCPQCGSSDTDAPTIGKLLLEHDNLAKFARTYPEVIDYAVKLIGRICNMGMHSGALIIADRTLYGNIPLAKSGSRGYWVSMWTEGRNTQLSKFGYCKWDVLGLKTLEYIFRCSQLIEQNRGISFGHNAEGWDDVDPLQNRAGHYFDGKGNKCYIDLNDPAALRLANEQKTDAVFQFDTDLAKSILANGVRHFEDLLFFNAAGHPGPMAAIPEAMANRNDPKHKWKVVLTDIHPELCDILKDTYGIILWQEQLAEIWQRLGGFTAPEAQDARKAVAKKWVHKLKPIGQKWIDGATRTIGRKNAEELWQKMITFGRYAFNKSHGVSYCLVAHHCLWLKAHFAPEFWAAVMSDCHPDKLVRYMSVARAEDWKPTDITYSGTRRPKTKANGVLFGTLNIENLTTNYTVTDDVVNQGLIGIKGIGEETATIFAGRGSWNNIDEFVQSAEGRKKKVVLERFIKLGVFNAMPGHENSKAVWNWYQYKYCGNVSDLKNEIKQRLLLEDGWNETAIANERQRQIAEYRRQFPKRNKIPPKFHNWNPKPDDSRERVMALYQEDFTRAEKLSFQKEFLGYYLDSPLELFSISGGCTIKDVKTKCLCGEEDALLEVMIIDQEFPTTKPKNGKAGSVYAKLTVTDGIQRALIFVWSNELGRQDPENFKEGVGIRIRVQYDQQRGTFTMRHGTNIIRLLANATA